MMIDMIDVHIQCWSKREVLAANSERQFYRYSEPVIILCVSASYWIIFSSTCTLKVFSFLSLSSTVVFLCLLIGHGSIYLKRKGRATLTLGIVAEAPFVRDSSLVFL